MAKYADLPSRLENPKFLTLTMPRCQDPKDGVNRLIESFAKLRRRRLFKRVAGGLYTIEVKPPSYPGQGWNVHLHAVIDGPYLPQKRLSKEWLDITRTAFIVDIRACRRPERALAYILGYTMRGHKVEQTWQSVGAGLRRAFEQAVKGRRFVQTFGCLHGEGAPTREFRCPRCGERAWLVVEFDRYLADTLQRAHANDRPPPDASSRAPGAVDDAP